MDAERADLKGVGAFLTMRPKQLHVWISEDDHEFLVRLAEERDEAIGLTIRRLIRQLKHAAAAPHGAADRDGIAAARLPASARRDCIRHRHR
jgi:hypothetical protein